MTDGLTQFPFVPGSESDITSLGESIANIGEALLSTQIASAGAGNIPDSWIGHGSDAYVQAMTHYQRMLIDSAEDFSPVQSAINAYGTVFTSTNTQIGELQEDWDTAHETFRTEKSTLDSGAGDLTQAEYDSALEELEQTRDLRLSELIESYDRTLDDLDEEAQTQSNTILSHLDSILSPETRIAGRDAVSIELFNDIPLLDGANEFAYYEPAAAEAAEYLAEPLTIERINEFNEKYGQLMENPFFANHLIEQMGPEQLADILPQLDDLMELAGGHHDLDGDGVPDTFDPDPLNDLVSGIGSVLILGTGGTNLGYPGTAQAFDAVDEGLVFSSGRSLLSEQALTRELLMTYGNTVLNAPTEPDPTWDPYYGKHGYDYLITAMGAAATEHSGLTAGKEFLLGNGTPGSSMAQDMLAWEKEHGGSRLEDPSRGPWASDSRTSLFGAERGEQGYSNVGQTLARLMDHVDGDETSRYAGYLSEANDQRADLVRTFLAGDTEFLDEQMNLARYLTGHRELGFEWSDGGEIFSEILLEASDPMLNSAPVEPGPDATSEEWEAFELAKDEWIEENREAAFVALGFTEGYQEALTYSVEVEGDPGRALRNGEEYFGENNPELRARAGEILAPYADGISDSFIQRYGEHAVVESENWADGHDIQVTDSMVRAFMGEASIFRDMARHDVASGPNSIEIFNKAANEVMTRDIEDTIREGGTVDDIAKTAAKHVPLMFTGNMAETMTEVEIEVARDIRMRAIEAVTTEAVSQAVPLGWLADQAVSHMIEYIIPDDFAEGMTDEVQAEQDALRQEFQESIYGAVWNTWDDASWRDIFDTSNIEIRDPIEHMKYAEENGAFPGQPDFYKTMLDSDGEMLPWDQLGPEQQQAFYDYLEYYGFVGDRPILNSADAGGSQEWDPYEYREDGQADSPVHNPAGGSDEEFDIMDEVLGDPYGSGENVATTD